MMTADGIMEISDLGKAAAQPQMIEVPQGMDPLVVLPEGKHPINLAKHLSTPMRVVQTVHLDDEASFLEYVARFEHTWSTVFLNAPGIAGRTPTATALLDYHQGNGDEPATPSHTDHCAIYTLHWSNEWSRWFGKNDDPMNQKAMALFLEENAVDIKTDEDDAKSPSGADMLQIALALELRSSAAVSGAVRLDSGDVKFQFVQETSAGTKNKDLNVPSYFWISIPVFRGGPLYRIKCWLRYTLKSSDDGSKKPMLRFCLHRPHVAYSAAIEDVRTALNKGLLSMVIMGSPA